MRGFIDTNCSAPSRPAEWHACGSHAHATGTAARAKKRAAARNGAPITSARRGTLPDFVPPQLATSTDGGQTWQKIIYKNENTGASDVEIDPSNPDVIYASMWEAREGPWEDNNEVNGTGGGLFKSTDGGNTWNPRSIRMAGM